MEVIVKETKEVSNDFSKWTRVKTFEDELRDKMKGEFK